MLIDSKRFLWYIFLFLTERNRSFTLFFICSYFLLNLSFDVLKKQCISWEFCEISKNTFFTEHLWATAPQICIFLDVSETSKKYLSQIPHKNGFAWFAGVIEISDKIDVRPLETLKKWNVFWKQCIAIN